MFPTIFSTKEYVMKRIQKLIVISVLLSASAQAGLVKFDTKAQMAGNWTDGTSTMHVVKHANGLAISGFDQRSVFLLNCYKAGAKESINRYICQGSGYNEKGPFKLQSIVEFTAGALHDSWSATQDGKLWAGDSVLKAAKVELLPVR
jgi:hypothetical protein